MSVEQEIVTRRPRFRISPETRMLADRIASLEVGETITYKELSSLVGEDVQKSAGGALRAARRMCQRDKQIVTDPVTNVGIIRLSDNETVASGDSVMRKIRRAARRGIDRVSAVSRFDDLPNESKIRHNALMSGFGVVAAFMKPKSIKKIEGAVNTAQTGQLPIGRTLEVFQRRETD